MAKLYACGGFPEALKLPKNSTEIHMQGTLLTHFRAPAFSCSTTRHSHVPSGLNSSHVGDELTDIVDKTTVYKFRSTQHLRVRLIFEDRQVDKSFTMTAYETGLALLERQTQLGSSVPWFAYHLSEIYLLKAATTLLLCLPLEVHQLRAFSCLFVLYRCRAMQTMRCHKYHRSLDNGIIRNL